ncbi:hypothetical protein PC116_g16076 [Phytophthora cactorum]|uniref:Uncharacterized protein n=1 Tax=Phytophthora cactorum TaxID=29920 RepID=A0A8T1BF66_9STRA|nr:hypothetical protein Pcac1_g4991 [Phytophthora cactorum]KAG2889813.1 hypothetical protein PC114_g17771 [Phytophthora cactorum]KAG2900562.1 hypothetical protein PC117_g21951 [Phytophthora cactorum]KAG2965253.1 hypothetical protein PC118_g19859 [Phytophthora cactorum]KAG2978965.1 hypothetical protein PC119_g21614 [Phytophthora cactorum]
MEEFEEGLAAGRKFQSKREFKLAVPADCATARECALHGLIHT